MGSCDECGHAKGSHYDARGCHETNCHCLTFFDIKKEQRFSFERPILYNQSPFLKELWTEIKEWHGHPI